MEKQDEKIATDILNEENYKLTVILSTDGKHSVVVETNSEFQRKQGIPAAKTLYEKILNEYGTKQGQAVREYGREKNGLEKKLEEEIFTCKTCGAPAKKRSGETKGKPWSGIFCTSNNRSHVQWL